MKRIMAALLVVGALGMMPAMSHAANANQCKDAKGKFIKCPTSSKSSSSSSSAMASSSASVSAQAKCRDAKGKFIACKPATPPKPKSCRDAKGKFVKCT